MEEANNTNIQQRVEKTLAQTFEVSPAEVATLGMGLHPRWDSMGHMEVIMKIEKEFGVRFPTYEIAELVTPAAIVTAIERHSQK